MRENYKEVQAFWNSIFKKFDKPLPEKLSTGVEALDNAIQWLKNRGNHLLDFGFGSGLLLLMTAHDNSGRYHGIDISEEACNAARKIFTKADISNAFFEQGSVERLTELDSDCYDSVILSNVVDNLRPDDARTVLRETHRILKPKGRVLFKANPYISDKEVEESSLKPIEEDFYLEPSGLFLWNLSTEKWRSLLEEYFTIVSFEDVFIERARQTNRLFLLEKR